MPEKTVDYALKLARKSLDTFSPEDAIRVAKIALEFLEDEDWSGDPSIEGEARLMHAQGQRMTGTSTAPCARRRPPRRCSTRPSSRPVRSSAILFAAEAAWQARRIDDARRWVERGIDAARSASETGALVKLLSLGATVANLRGEYARATAYQAEMAALTPREKSLGQEIPRGGTLIVAMPSPMAATEPAIYDTTEEHEVLANVFETLVTVDSQGNLAPKLCRALDPARTAAARCELHLRRGVVFSDGSAAERARP